jgi:F0F1-type ATP synthase assembly protein I
MTKNPKNNPRNTWARFSGMGIQMGVVIVLGFFGGRKLDETVGSRKPWFTLLFGLLGVFAAIYLVIKEVKSLERSDE